MDDIEEVLRDKGPDGLVPEQRYRLGHSILQGTVESMVERTGADSGEWLLPRLVSHWAFAGPEQDDNSLLVRAAMATWAGGALHVLTKPEERAEYTTWRKANRLPGFAGDKLPDHVLPCALVWYETGYPAGRYPTLVPVRDIGVKTNLVKIKRVALMATHNFSAMPFPDRPDDPNFLKTASIVAFIEDAIGEIHTYGGVVTYGKGGALVWRVNNVAELQAALHGDGPGGPMSNLSQFTAAELAYLIGYHKQFDYEGLRDQVMPSPVTDMGEEYDDNVSDA